MSIGYNRISEKVRMPLQKDITISTVASSLQWGISFKFIVAFLINIAYNACKD